MVKEKLLFLVLLLVASSIPTKAQARPGRTAGMTQIQALEIAVDCVSKAAGFDKISGTRKIHHYRVEDKLDFLGITDNTRLNALRRYLVRNEEIGTQRKEYVNKVAVDIPRFYRFMMTSHDLLVVKKDWTLLKLAQFIADKAGVSLIPPGTARSILSDCRAYADNRKPYDLIPPIPAPTPSPTPLFAPINDTLQLGALDTDKRQLFAECVVSNKRYGIPSVSFDSTKGDTLSYSLEINDAGAAIPTKTAREMNATAWIASAIANGWTYDCLTTMIVDYSKVSLPKSSLAGEIAMTAILRNIKPDPNKPERPFEFDKGSKLGVILRSGPPGSDGLATLNSEIKSNVDPAPVVSTCAIPSAGQGKLNNRGSVNANWVNATPEMSVEQLIARVKSNL